MFVAASSSFVDPSRTPAQHRYGTGPDEPSPSVRTDRGHRWRLGPEDGDSASEPPRPARAGSGSWPTEVRAWVERQHLVRRLVRELGTSGFGPRSPGRPRNGMPSWPRRSRLTGCRCLVAVGGDGTVSALINEQPKVPITVLPAGTENLAAQHFRLRRNPVLLARTIAAGQRGPHGRRLRGGPAIPAHDRLRLRRRRGDPAPPLPDDDLGKVKPTHRAAYVEPILRASLFYRFPPISVRDRRPGGGGGAERNDGLRLQPASIRPGTAVRPQACQDDGLLDLVVFRDPGPFQALYYLWRVLRGTHLDHPGVFHRRVRRVRRDLARGGSGPARRRSRGIPPASPKPGRQRAKPRARARRSTGSSRSFPARSMFWCRRPATAPRGSARQNLASRVRIPAFPRTVTSGSSPASGATGGSSAAASRRRKGGRRGHFHSKPRHRSGGSRSARGRPLALIAGPCVMEPGDLTERIARRLAEICESLGMSRWSSRPRSTRPTGPRSPAIAVRACGEGMKIFARIKAETGLAGHHRRPRDAPGRRPIAEVVDLLQVPAFLARQTDLLEAAAADRASREREERPVHGPLGHGQRGDQADRLRGLGGPPDRARHHLRLRPAGQRLAGDPPDARDGCPGGLRRDPFGAASRRRGRGAPRPPASAR